MHYETQEWYTITYTSGIHCSGYDYPGDYERHAKKIHKLTGLSTAVQIKEHHSRSMNEGHRVFAVMIHIRDMADLCQVQNTFGGEIIFEAPWMNQPGHIELYDDYRE